MPQLIDLSDDYTEADLRFGPVYVGQGGLVDGGSLKPNDPQELDPDFCNTAPPGECFFDITAPDGKLDLGFYYVQGGEVDYDMVSFELGVRYTF